MFLFLIGIAFLIAGYFTYGKLVEKILGPDDRQPPAVAHPDGVDYVVLPHWKNMLIQLLNIAGVGPVIGVILGIKFGTITFVIIPIGCVFAGAVHDFVAGMMSLRSNGANLTELVRQQLGRKFARIFSATIVVILLLVVAVFINVPSNLLYAQFIHGTGAEGVLSIWVIIGAIFIYYIVATLFPVDKIIGTLYPFFGAMLLVGTIAIFGALLIAGFKSPELLAESEAFREGMFKAPNAPIFPLLFVTIACGIISGFHATQSPIVARTMKTEREARSNFYGMMILEGIIAMIWAAAALAIYNLHPEYMKIPAATVLGHITSHFLGSWMGSVTVIAVVILAITSGDTALRSVRLSLAEMFHVKQDKFAKRIGIVLPLVGIVLLLLVWSNADAKSFNHLWNYFAWGNQLLAATTLLAGTAWLIRQGHKRACLVTLIPGLFMTAVVSSFIVWTRPDYGQPVGIIFKIIHNGTNGAEIVPTGFDIGWAVLTGSIVALSLGAVVILYALRKKDVGETTEPEKKETP